MNRKRWLALGIAIVLFAVSIGFRFATSVASQFIAAEFPSLDEVDYIHENVIEDGKMGNKVAVIHLKGMIQDVDSPSLIGTSSYHHENFLKQIDRAAEDPLIEAVILAIDSPGGGVVESAQIHERLEKLINEHEKPLYVSMGTTAASGGYYVAAPADKIFAEKATLTGSIGVIMENINFTEFAEKHGIKFNTITSGKHKDILSPSREMTDEERDILQSMIDEMYGDFVDVIVNGRGMDEKKVRKLADGRVYTGKQAQDVGLVDEIGSLEDTIKAIKEDYNLEGAQVVEYDYSFDFFNLFGMKISELFKGSKTEINEIIHLLNEYDHPRAMYLYPQYE